MLSRSRRVFRRKPTIRSQHAALVLLAATVAVLLLFRQERLQSPSPETLAEGTYRIERVVDGDTLLLQNGARIRLYCADTPETVKPNHPVEPFGPEATQFTKDFLASGSVYLTFDRERLDRYGRFLAYAWRDASMELMLNEELIRAGLAEAKTGFRFSSSMKRRFRQAEDEAQSQKRGIWSGTRPAGHSDSQAP